MRVEPMEITFEEMVEFVDEDLANSVEDLIVAKRKTISTVEMTIAALLATSVANSFNSMKEVEEQINAYMAFIKIVAVEHFVGRRVH